MNRDHKLGQWYDANDELHNFEAAIAPLRSGRLWGSMSPAVQAWSVAMSLAWSLDVACSA